MGKLLEPAPLHSRAASPGRDKWEWPFRCLESGILKETQGTSAHSCVRAGLVWE